MRFGADAMWNITDASKRLIRSSCSRTHGMRNRIVIITSAEMTASKALEHYKNRDVSEKLSRADKYFLGNRTMRAHMNETENARTFIEFVALIVRNRIYH